MSVPSATSCPHHNPSREFSCCLQGPDKVSTLLAWLLLVPQKITAANPAVWWSMSPSPISVGHGGGLPSVVFISHLWRGESKTRWGCVLPCWVLLINVRNGTRGYEALNWCVISYMGFAKCLGLDNKQGPSGPASVKELPYESITPRGMLSAAVQARGSFCAWHTAVLGCTQQPSSCSLPQGANSTDISLLLAAACLIFMLPNAKEYPNNSCAQRCRALPRYFAAWVSFPLALGSA